MGKIKDIKGQRFGRLVAVEIFGKNKWRSYQWLCKCNCGNEVVVDSGNLLRGNSQSCGCLNQDDKTTHGLSKHPLYIVWCNMKARCYNPNKPKYKNYGARGITVCQQWRDNFKTFYDWCIVNGWKKGLQIDRIDNNGDYEPDNCRFVTPKKNMRNTQTSKVWVVDGIRYQNVNSAAKALGTSEKTIRRRCKKKQNPIAIAIINIPNIRGKINNETKLD